MSTLLPLPLFLDRPRTESAPREALLVRVAELLHAYGTPAHRLERLLARMARSLGLEAQFLSTPTSLLAAFGPADDQRTHLLRVEPGDVDLGKLVEFDELLEDLEHGRVDVALARTRAEALAAAPPRYGTLAMVIAFGVASAGAAVLFGGGWREVLAAFLLASPLAPLSRWLSGREETARVFEPAAAAFAAAGALMWPLSTGRVTLAALIVLVPGLTLTVATIELTTRHLVSGTARLAGALTTFLMIALGLALGRSAAVLAGFDSAPINPTPLGWWATWLAVLVSPLAFALLFQARRRELGVIWLTSVAGYLVALLGSRLSPEAGPFLGALAIGVLSNGYARYRDRPALVPLTPGILMLVPGSIGFRALDFFLASNPLEGTETVFRMAIVATALAGGLLLAGALVPPRRTL